MHGLGGKVIIFHLHADPARRKTEAVEQNRKVLHGVQFGGLNETVFVPDDTVKPHPDGPQRTLRIHQPPPPDGVGIRKDHNTLMHIKGPAVIPCQPRLIGRIGYE